MRKLSQTMTKISSAGWPWLVLLGLVGSGCKQSEQTDTGSTAPAPAGSTSAPGAQSLTLDEQKDLLPAGLSPYSGPVGSVEGVVHITGDEAPILHELLNKIPKDKKCDPARTAYQRLFREGPGRTLADALVTVTNYELPEGQTVVPRSPTVGVKTEGCAFDTRTIAMTQKQHILVHNVGGTSAMPSVAGAPELAVMVAMPGGDPVKLPVPRPGRFGLVDRSNDFAFANVFVLKYATAAVTRPSGTFTIEGVPVGKADVTAYLPIIGAQVTKHVEVRQGHATRVELELSFDATRFKAAQNKPSAEAAPAASAGASGAPVGSAAPAASAR